MSLHVKEGLEYNFCIFETDKLTVLGVPCNMLDFDLRFLIKIGLLNLGPGRDGNELDEMVFHYIVKAFLFQQMPLGLPITICVGVTKDFRISF